MSITTAGIRIQSLYHHHCGLYFSSTDGQVFFQLGDVARLSQHIEVLAYNQFGQGHGFIFWHALQLQ